MSDTKDIDARIRRAKTLISELEVEVLVFFKKEPYQAILQEEPLTGDAVVKVKINAEPPAEWKIRVGEVIHHLRSSLDLIVEQLIKANGATPTKQTSFPVYETVAEFNRSAPSKVAGVNAKKFAIIEQLRPYQGGNDLLWKLHKLDIEDKHHKLIVAGSALHSVVIDLAAGLRSMRPERMLFPLIPTEREFPLTDGCILYRISARGKASHPPELPTYRFEIAYGDGKVVIGEPLIESLHEFVTTVEDIIKRLTV